tara:strand:- start:350 stop:514 length:165 start_codon:yes stop_codon:yes gene_type:complete
MAEHRIRTVIHQSDRLFHITAGLIVLAEQGLHQRTIPPGFRLIWEGFHTVVAAL